MNTITLIGDWKTRKVILNGNLLDPAPSQKIRNHSPDGFMWGYGGSGPAQLALAICLKLYGAEKAQKVYQDFKFKHIGSLPQTDFDVQIEVEEYGSSAGGLAMSSSDFKTAEERFRSMHPMTTKEAFSTSPFIPIVHQKATPIVRMLREHGEMLITKKGTYYCLGMVFRDNPVVNESGIEEIGHLQDVSDQIKEIIESYETLGT